MLISIINNISNISFKKNINIKNTKREDISFKRREIIQDEKHYGDGSKRSEILCSPDETKIIRDTDVYGDKTEHITFPDGTKEKRFNDVIQHQYFPDRKCSIKYKDGKIDIISFQDTEVHRGFDVLSDGTINKHYNI